MRLKIEQKGFNPHGCKVWLEGVELTHLMSLTLETSADEFTVATLRIGVDDLDVDVESAAHLIAMLRDRAAQQEAA